LQGNNFISNSTIDNQSFLEQDEVERSTTSFSA